MPTTTTAPHQDQPIYQAGRPLADATAAMIMVHQRGGRADAFLNLAQQLYHPDLAYLAPQAGGYTWYPYSFLAPIPNNEPGISSGIQALTDLVADIEANGIPADKIIIAGFSQGACLAAEFVARHGRPLGGLIAFSGGLIGPDNTPRDYDGNLSGMPIFLGCSDVDNHVPLTRVNETDETFTRMGASVTKRIYPGMAHTINDDELQLANQLINNSLA
ncbi:MAG TPA: dienelactone hydrolase family protein [Anaerolineae bacterium]|nr:dienelactone hydrolase family protein [Anaerolineae bacterium]